VKKSILATIFFFALSFLLIGCGEDKQQSAGCGVTVQCTINQNQNNSNTSQPTQPVSGNTPTNPVNTTNTNEGACLGKNDYPITDTLSGLSSGFYRIEFYVGTGSENESWLPAGPGVSYKVNSNVNGHVWEFPSASCTSTDMMNDAIATHRRRSAEGYTVNSSPYVDPSDPLVTSNFIKQ